MNSRLINFISLLILVIFFTSISANISAAPSPYPGQINKNYRPGPVAKQSYYSEQTQGPSPIDLLEKSIANTMSFLAHPKSADYKEVTKFVIQEMAPNFDFNYMSRWIAGRHYLRLSNDQKSQFTKTFTELFISTFVQKLRKFKPSLNGSEVFRSRRISRNEVIANVQLLRNKQQTIDLDFRFIKTPSGWKVVDIKANGISALMYYRQYFANKIRQRRS